jgi:hypothetical protein
MKHFPAPIESADNAARLVIGGEQIDMRTREARRFKAILRDLAEQMDREPTASERLQLMSAATLAMCIERDTLAMLRGEIVEQEPMRRNAVALRACLTSLGLAMKSRDISRKDYKRGPSLLGDIAGMSDG